MTEKEDRWEAIVEELRGTCDSPASKGEEVEDLFDDLDFCAFVDERIFRCNQCQWWCEMHEEVSEFHGLGEWTCRDCAGGEDD